MCRLCYGLWIKTVSLAPSRASGDRRSGFVTSMFSDSAIYFLLAPGPKNVPKPSIFPLVRANTAELLASCVLLGSSCGLLAALESAPPSSQRAIVVNLPPGASIVPVPLTLWTTLPCVSVACLPLYRVLYRAVLSGATRMLCMLLAINTFQ